MDSSLSHSIIIFVRSPAAVTMKNTVSYFIGKSARWNKNDPMQYTVKVQHHPLRFVSYVWNHWSRKFVQKNWIKFRRLVANNWNALLSTGNQKLIKCPFVAVVTGSTQGIGKAYAEAVSSTLWVMWMDWFTGFGLLLQLAKQGINVVLISRSLDKLQKLAADIGKFTLNYAFLFCNFTPKYKS